jgi:FkbM family methyltransferase
MIAMRELGALGKAARVVRRAGLGGALRGSMDLVDRALVRAGVPPLAAEVGGVEFRGYLRHRGFLEYIQQGMPGERFYGSLLLGALDERTTFVDAGAHIGVYSLLACRRARRVLAFEPDPYNLAALHANVDRCGCANIEIRPQAIADRAGRSSFRSFRSTFSGSLAPRNVDAFQELDVELVRLDDVLIDSDLTSLVVKLDVEGAEPLALVGMRTIAREATKLVIFAEINPEALEAGGWSAEQLVQDLLTSGMECDWIDEDRGALEPIESSRLQRRGNLMCVKGSSG